MSWMRKKHRAAEIRRAAEKKSSLEFGAQRKVFAFRNSAQRKMSSLEYGVQRKCHRFSKVKAAENVIA